MNSYEIATLALATLNLGVLSSTLWILRGYAKNTGILARCAVEQTPRPCVTIHQLRDPSDVAVFESTSISIESFRTLHFANVGTAPAVNLRFSVGVPNSTEQSEFTSGPVLDAGESFDSAYPRNALADRALIVIEYESVAGSSYRSEAVIEDRRWVKSVRFSRPNRDLQPTAAGVLMGRRG